MAKIIDGRRIAKEIERELSQKIEDMQSKGVRPGLAVILVGDDPASRTYVRSKEKACKRVGIYSRVERKPADISQEQLLELIQELNDDPGIHGILVQLPLPRHIDPQAVIHAIDPRKDVDGFHPFNVGEMFVNQPGLWPCTPHGVIEMLDRSGIEIEGQHAVIVGASNIVGKPMATMLLNREATITVCHIKTRDLAHHTRQADILVVAVGKPDLITADMVKEGVVVIDVGINRLADGRLVGDVAFEEVKEKASAITPVPGGVGPMTIAMLLKNTVEAAERW